MKILISGGGTGGHIFPALAIADSLKEKYPQAKFLFVGASDRIEMQTIPKAGYEIKGLWITGFQRGKILKNILLPLKILCSLFKSFWIVKRFSPTIVIGTGGFASGSVLYIASFLKIPTLIQEQNSFAGLTNKLLANKVNRICVAYDGMERFFPKHKIVKTGNPVRKALCNLKNDKRFLEKVGLDFSKKTILILGGSLGALKINQIIENSLDFFEENNLQIIWQTGKRDFKKYEKYACKKNIFVTDFIDKMNELYQASDFIISRAGAIAIAELCWVGKVTMLIPSPNVAENHQLKNAQVLEKNKAGILLEEKNIQNFQTCFSEILKDENIQKIYAENIQKLKIENTKELILNQIEELLIRK